MKEIDFLLNNSNENTNNSPIIGVIPINFDNEYNDFIRLMNGGYFFDNALHIYGFCDSPNYHDLTYVNSLFRKYFDKVFDLEDYICFGSDIFNNQFAFSVMDRSIYFINIETGDKEKIADNFLGWLLVIKKDLDYYTGQSFVKQWEEVMGEIGLSKRLTPKMPFIIGGEYSFNNLYSSEIEKIISFNADLAIQIYNLPDGAEVKIEIRG